MINAGDLNLLQISIYDIDRLANLQQAASAVGITTSYVSPDTQYGYNAVGSAINGAVTSVVDGTSTTIGGNFALEFNGARTIYLPHSASANEVKFALESLDTIGQVDVARNSGDENNGFTWSVTFMTELGDVSDIVFDDKDMTGTMVSGVVSTNVVGVYPGFNSLDQANNLPLGSTIISDLSNLSLTIGNLDEGIAYYIRVAAINAVGQGPYGVSATPYAIPSNQRPGRPVTPDLSIKDGTSMNVKFNPPVLDGGKDVTFYRVEYAEQAFTPAVQKVKIASVVTPEVQVIDTQVTAISEVQILYISTTVSPGLGSSIPEKKKVICDATGGSFRLSFGGYTTDSIAYNADATTVKTKLEALEILNTVNVVYSGITTACFSRAATPAGYFEIEFSSVVNMAGNLPVMTATTNSLQGLRFVDITAVAGTGLADIGGYFRLSFRGAVTEDITIIASSATLATNIGNALGKLDTIPVGGVTVSSEDLSGNAALSLIHI